LNAEDIQLFLKKLKPINANKVGCPQQPVQCTESSKFRSIDGTCNNLENPHWGEQNTLFSRLLTPAYSNG
jgi:hypothetical protein